MNAIEALQRVKDSGGRLGARRRSYGERSTVTWQPGREMFAWQYGDHRQSALFLGESILATDWELVELEESDE